MIGRRGPAQAKFTTKELRELGELDGVEIAVGPGEADLDEFDPTGGSARLAETDRHVRGNYTVIAGWADREPAAAPRRLSVRFWLRPVEILGTDRVTGLRVERTRLDADGRFTGTGETQDIPVQMVLRSVGYQSVPLPGVPFDERSAVVPNEEGRVTGPDGKPLPGEYVAGWLKRGPTGVIGTNKSDAAQTVRALLADLAGLLRLPADAQDGAGGPSRFAALLASRGQAAVSYADWLRIETAERELAAELGRGTRVKLASRADLHRACGLSG
jgi:ferredoxin--NADP+ reductase